MNSDIDHRTDCVFYDSELSSLSKDFDDIYRILKRIKKRAERKQTIQLSKSLFDYVERRTTLSKVPQNYYDLVFDDYRCCMYFYRGTYWILCVGFEYPYLDDFFKRSLTWTNKGNLYGSFPTIDDAKPYFVKCCNFLTENLFDSLFIGDDIPF